MNLVWYLTPGNETETMDALKNEGVQVRSGLGVEPLTIIATSLAGAALVRVLIKLYRDARYTGVLIDATRIPVEVREMPGWSRRQVLVITPTGPHFQNIGTEESASNELGMIAKLLDKD